MVIIVTLHMRIEWSVSFPVQWYNFHYGGGRRDCLGTCPLDFFFLKFQILPKLATQAHAMHCIFSSPEVSFSYGEGGSGTGGGGMLPQIFFLFTKWKVVFSHITHAHHTFSSDIILTWPRGRANRTTNTKHLWQHCLVWFENKSKSIEI